MRLEFRLQAAFTDRSGGRLKAELRTIKRPLPLQLFNRAAINIDIHIVLRARNCVEAGGSIGWTAVLFAGKLPERVGLPEAPRKVGHVSFEPRIPEQCL